MHLTSLRTLPRGPLALGLILASCCAQSAAVLPAQSNGNATPPEANRGALAGLPDFLLLVPGGTVEMGMTSDALINSAAQVVSPTRPKPADAAKISAEKLVTAMRRSASALGKRKVDVEPFLLAKWPVKCGEYESFVLSRRNQGVKVRVPFHWWRFGAADHYASVLPEIAKQFPKDPLGPLLYWERHGADVPYALKDERGQSIADHPVTYVDYREANDFAAAFGMRLPTEAEWTRAARGEGANLWPWGKAAKETDVFTEEALKSLQIFGSRERALKPVGSVSAGTGPFGHLDMFGQVWQLVSGIGYRPINGADPFAAEWKELQKDKVGALMQSPPAWKDDRALGKGGCYLSSGEPIQLLVDARAPVQTIEVLEGLGFRLAKSPRPGYDLLYSLLRGAYNRTAFAADQDIALDRQVGAEKYDLGPDGFPTAYHAVSFAPVDGLSADKNVSLEKLLEQSVATPFVVGTFATTTPLVEPTAPAGHYTVLFRKDGMPRELVEAIKQGHKELAAKPKPKEKEEEPAEDDGDGKPEGKPKDEKTGKGKGKAKEQERKGSWREVIARFGITEQDLAPKEAANGLKFVRIDGMEVPTDHDCFLLHGPEGKIVGVVRATNQKPAHGTPGASTLSLEADPKGRALARFVFNAPLCLQNPKKVVSFVFAPTLDRPLPGADAAWRLPTP